jgi:hypothetical protein
MVKITHKELHNVVQHEMRMSKRVWNHHSKSTFRNAQPEWFCPPVHIHESVLRDGFLMPHPSNLFIKLLHRWRYQPFRCTTIMIMSMGQSPSWEANTQWRNSPPFTEPEGSLSCSQEREQHYATNCGLFLGEMGADREVLNYEDDLTIQCWCCTQMSVTCELSTPGSQQNTVFRFPIGNRLLWQGFLGFLSSSRKHWDNTLKYSTTTSNSVFSHSPSRLYIAYTVDKESLNNLRNKK